RFERAEATLALGGLSDEERLVDQAREQVEHVFLRDTVAGADPLGGGEGAAAGEDGEAPEYRALFIGEEVVAPVDRCAERLVAGHRNTTAAGEQAEAVIEPRRDLLDGQGANARGGELEREWDAIEALADLHH